MYSWGENRIVNGPIQKVKTSEAAEIIGLALQPSEIFLQEPIPLKVMGSWMLRVSLLSLVLSVLCVACAQTPAIDDSKQESQHQLLNPEELLQIDELFLKKVQWDDVTASSRQKAKTFSHP